MKITERLVSAEEAKVLSGETRKSPHIGFIGPDLWNTFTRTYVATINKHMVGVCVAFPLSRWVKLGPLIILSSHQGKGYGKILLTEVVKKNEHAKLFVGSSNPKVHAIIRGLGFEEAPNFLHVPLEVQTYLIQYVFMRASYTYLIDAIRKKLFFHRGKYRYYLRRMLV